MEYLRCLWTKLSTETWRAEGRRVDQPGRLSVLSPSMYRGGFHTSVQTGIVPAKTLARCVDCTDRGHQPFGELGQTGRLIGCLAVWGMI